jgi:hypothetical protein
MFNWQLKVPFLYQNTYITLANLAKYMDNQGYEWAAARRHLALLHARGGKLGFGGGWRKCPHPVSQASMDCESFHQDQLYSNGWKGPTAIDYVWEDGPDAGDWHDGVPTGGVPVQGSAEAKLFGIHANIGVPGFKGFESWHGQPVEIDGFASATDGGRRPAPMIDPKYPLPQEHDPDYVPPSGGGGDEMETMLSRRVMDTRGTGPSYDAFKLPGNTTKTIPIPEAKGFKVAQVTITIGQCEGEGFLTQWPSGAKPETSFQNYQRGQFWTPETLFVQLDGNGSFQLWSLAKTHLIIDFTGVVGR